VRFIFDTISYMKNAKKKSSKIGEAVFRGKKMHYNFEMFPLDIEIEPIPAVYLITKRKLDKQGKGHHALICVGQAESLSEDLKKHVKGKCIKKLKANVVCVLQNDNEKSRLKIEEDLKLSFAVPCLHQ
jgi:hypothetical protein